MSDHGDWGKKRDAALFSQQAKNEEAMMNKVLESMRRAEAQTGYDCDWEAAVKMRTKEMEFHYEKLCKLEKVAREWIAGKQVAYGIYSELVDEATTSEGVERWSRMAIRAREDSEYLTELLKEAGLE